MPILPKRVDTPEKRAKRKLKRRRAKETRPPSR